MSGHYKLMNKYLFTFVTVFAITVDLALMRQTAPRDCPGVNLAELTSSNINEKCRGNGTIECAGACVNDGIEQCSCQIKVAEEVPTCKQEAECMFFMQYLSILNSACQSRFDCCSAEYSITDCGTEGKCCVRAGIPVMPVEANRCCSKNVGTDCNEWGACKCT